MLPSGFTFPQNSAEKPKIVGIAGGMIGLHFLRFSKRALFLPKKKSINIILSPAEN